MKIQLLLKIALVITIAIALQACGLREARVDKDELGELITSIEEKKRLEAEAFTGTGTLRTLRVTASAYNSLPGQTDSRPNEAAWGDILRPGMKAIAVSRDLLAMGLKRNTKVKIKGLPGTYRVLDKMNKRWTKKIDIYMGVDKRKAMQWGRRNVEISWYSN